MPPTCGFVGDSDFYGFGIRLGSYFQWTATLLATIYLPGDVSPLRAINLIIQLSLFAGLVMLNKTSTLQTVEPMIIVWLMFGGLSSLTSRGFSPLRSLSGACRIALYAAVSSYATWFWFVGVTEMKPTPCGTVVFFDHVELSPTSRRCGEALSVIALIVCAALALTGLAVALARAEPGGDEAGGDGGERDREYEHEHEHPTIEIGLLALSLAMVAISIASVEYLIRKNHIVGVYGVVQAGQLIPLIIGSYTLAKAIYRSAGADRPPYTLFGTPRGGDK